MTGPLHRVLVPLVLVLVAVAACGEPDEAVVRDEERAVGVYAAVIVDVADTLPPDEDGEDPARRVVFVEPLEPEEMIPIEVQAGIILELEDVVSVVFIDDRGEAVDLEEEEEPVRDGAALVAMGPLVHGEQRVGLDVVRYESEDDEERFRYVVERVGDTWEVVERRTIG